MFSRPFYLQGVNNVGHEDPVGVPDQAELVLVLILRLELPQGCLELDKPGQIIKHQHFFVSTLVYCTNI